MTMRQILLAILASAAIAAFAQPDTRYDPWADFPTYPADRDRLPDAPPLRSTAVVEPIYVRNASSQTMWVGVRGPDGSPVRAICVEPKSDARVEVRGGRWSVRVVAFRPGCVVTS